MADVNQQRILQLAQQGNLQAIAVILNRPLIPKGAHVKIRANADCLQVLLETPNSVPKETLLPIIEQQIVHLQLSTFSKSKVYSPKPGTSKASLIHTFPLKSAPRPTAAPHPTMVQPSQSPLSLAQPDLSDLSRRTDPDPPQLADPVPAAPTLHLPDQPVQMQEESSPTVTAPPQPATRYSVATFLCQVKSLQDLNVLKSHPFITGHCPQCGSAYDHNGALPTYWDCGHCGWVDDLSEIASLEAPVANTAESNITASKLMGTYLIEAGLLNEAQIQVALADQEMTGMRLGEALVRRGWIKEETIEYLMQKVVLPERQGHEPHGADLELSRNLIQALIGVVPVKAQPPSPPTPTLRPTITADTSALKAAMTPDRPETKPNTPPLRPTIAPITVEQVREKIHGEDHGEKLAPMAEVKTPQAPHASSERATLVLPDFDLSDHLESETPEPVHTPHRS